MTHLPVAAPTDDSRVAGLGLRQAALLLACYGYTLFLGMNVALRGYLLPRIIDDFSISFTSSGLLFLLPGLPTIVGSLAAGLIFRRLKRRLVLTLSSLAVALSLFCQALAGSYAQFVGAALAYGFFSMLVFVGLNVVRTDFFRAHYPAWRSAAVTLLHFCFGLGATLSLLGGNRLLASGAGWRSSYLIMAALIVPVMLGVGVGHYVRAGVSRRTDTGVSGRTDAGVSRPSRHLHLGLLTHPQALLFAMATILYCGTEIAIASWSPTFLEKGAGFAPNYSSYVMVLFFVLFTAGRLAGAFVIQRLHQPLCYLVFALLTGAFAVLAYVCELRPGQLDWFIILCGASLSILFPIIQNLLTAAFPDELEMATAMLYAASNVGVALMPFVVGVLNDTVGVQRGIVVVVGFILASALFVLLATHRHGSLSARAGESLLARD